MSLDWHLEWHATKNYQHSDALRGGSDFRELGCKRSFLDNLHGQFRRQLKTFLSPQAHTSSLLGRRTYALKNFRTELN